MKSSITILSLLFSIVLAIPTLNLERRQGFALDIGGRNRDEVERGSCRKVSFVWARASTEVGNMGTSMGPAVCTGLKKKYGENEVACQGVGGPYAAGLLDNVSLSGTTSAAINEMKRLLGLAASKCPKTILVAGGYSQGSALAMNAVSQITKSTRDRIVGVVLYGYTKNAQTSGSIPNYPKERVKVFCASDDGVCSGSLLVTLGHFAYLTDGSGQQGTDFLIKWIESAKSAAEEGVPAEGKAPPPTSRPKPKSTGKGKSTGRPRPTSTPPADDMGGMDMGTTSAAPPAETAAPEVVPGSTTSTSSSSSLEETVYVTSTTYVASTPKSTLKPTSEAPKTTATRDTVKVTVTVTETISSTSVAPATSSVSSDTGSGYDMGGAPPSNTACASQSSAPKSSTAKSSAPRSSQAPKPTAAPTEDILEPLPEESAATAKTTPMPKSDSPKQPPKPKSVSPPAEEALPEPAASPTQKPRPTKTHGVAGALNDAGATQIIENGGIGPEIPQLGSIFGGSKAK